MLPSAQPWQFQSGCILLPMFAQWRQLPQPRTGTTGTRMEKYGPTLRKNTRSDPVSTCPTPTTKSLSEQGPICKNRSSSSCGTTQQVSKIGQSHSTVPVASAPFPSQCHGTLSNSDASCTPKARTAMPDTMGSGHVGNAAGPPPYSCGGQRVNFTAGMHCIALQPE